MKRRLIVMGIALGVVFGGLLGWNLLRGKLRQDYLKKHQPGPTAVSVTAVTTKPYQPTLSAVGTLKAAEQVDVTSQAGGKVTKILFKDGQNVDEGDLLAVLDDEAQRSQLAGAVAQRDEAADAVRRYKPLLEEGAISQLKYDQLTATYKEANAQVGQAKAALSYVRVTAPFAGRVGIRQVNLGEMVRAGQNIVTLDTQGGLYCDFSLPESDRERVAVGQVVTLTTDVVPGKTFSGSVTAIDPEIDTSTRNFGVRATFPDEETALTPGSFANLALDVGQPEDVLMIPRTAIAYSLYGDTVYVLQESTKTERDKVTAYQVKKTTVTLGAQQADDVIVDKGLEAGELIVTSGQLRLEDGDWVTPKQNDLEPPKTLPLE
ncbi:MAG: efflux RND transporter periplasmic adaptor subunit [Myxococcota bacterium]